MTCKQLLAAIKGTAKAAGIPRATINADHIGPLFDGYLPSLSSLNKAELVKVLASLRASIADEAEWVEVEWVEVDSGEIVPTVPAVAPEVYDRAALKSLAEAVLFIMGGPQGAARKLSSDHFTTLCVCASFMVSK